MAEKLDHQETVSFEKLLIMELIKTQTIVQLLIEKGIITKEVQKQYEERQKNMVL